MHYGVILPQTEIGPDPALLVGFVEAAEAAGFDYVMVYDHVVGADTTDRPDWPGPYDLDSQFHEPMVLFGFLAAHCALELVTGVLVLPQRQTALVAKQAAQVDLLTGGRFRLGVGIGWNAPEYGALGVDFGTRADRYEEQIEVLRRLWTEDSVTFEGRYHRLEAVGILPRPVQRPIPLWMGGGSGRTVLERIGRLADGWISVGAPGHGLEEAVEVVRAAAVAAGRPDGAVGLQGLVQPGEDPGEARFHRQLARWAGVEASHLSVSGLGAGRSPEEHIRFVREAGVLLFG